MTIIRPGLEQVINLYGSSLPDYDYILKRTNSNNGWVKFSPRLYELMTKFKCHNYPELYQDENRIQAALFRALCETDEEIITLWNDLASSTEEEQVQYMNEFMEGANDFSQIIDENIIHLDDMDWSPAGQEKALEEWNKFSEKEQKQIQRFSQYSLAFSMASFFNYFAVMVHRKKLTQLVAEAMSGNTQSFCLAVHIDKTILEHIPYFKQRYQQAIQEGDQKFLELVSKQQSSPQLKVNLQHRLLYMLFAILEGTYWLDDLKHREILDICDQLRLDRYGSRIETENALTKQLGRYRDFQEFNVMSMP